MHFCLLLRIVVSASGKGAHDFFLVSVVSKGPEHMEACREQVWTLLTDGTMCKTHSLKGVLPS